MGPILFDTSVYVRDLHAGEDDAISARFLSAGTPVWLSSVVLQELYAGASGGEHKALARLQRDFERLRRVVTPTAGDWVNAGKLLAELATRYGYESIGRGRISNDALIATSCSRLGITVITTNTRDFARLATLRRVFWRAAEPPRS